MPFSLLFLRLNTIICLLKIIIQKEKTHHEKISRKTNQSTILPPRAKVSSRYDKSF